MSLKVFILEFSLKKELSSCRKTYLIFEMVLLSPMGVMIWSLPFLFLILKVIDVKAVPQQLLQKNGGYH